MGIRLITGIFTFLILCACGTTPEKNSAKAAKAARTKVVLLGTGTPNANPDRSGPAVAIVVNDTPYLVDAGPGIVRRAAAAYRAGVKGLAVKKLSWAFITHLHSDHTTGYPDLIFTPGVLGRTDTLHVFGPPGLDDMTRHLLAAYAQDLQVRLEGLEPADPAGYLIETHEVQPGPIYSDGQVRVIAFRVEHGSWPVALGYRFETPDGVIVVSGDTRFCPNLIRHSQGADILIHEVYSQAGFNSRPPDWQHYHATSHTSTIDLAEIANQVRPGKLILYHQLFWGATEEELLSEIRSRYDGIVVSGNDLDVFTP